MSYQYDVYGNIVNQQGSRYDERQFAGEQADPTGLTYLRARFYDSTTGRFLSRDPSPHCIYDPASTHPYSYAGDNPATNGDPSGLTTVSLGGQTVDLGDLTQTLRVSLFYGALARYENDPTDVTALIEFASLGVQVPSAAPPPAVASSDASSMYTQRSDAETQAWAGALNSDPSTWAQLPDRNGVPLSPLNPCNFGDQLQAPVIVPIGGGVVRATYEATSGAAPDLPRLIACIPAEETADPDIIAQAEEASVGLFPADANGLCSITLVANALWNPNLQPTSVKLTFSAGPIIQAGVPTCISP